MAQNRESINKLLQIWPNDFRQDDTMVKAWSLRQMELKKLEYLHAKDEVGPSYPTQKLTQNVLKP